MTKREAERVLIYLQGLGFVGWVEMAGAMSNWQVVVAEQSMMALSTKEGR